MNTNKSLGARLVLILIILIGLFGAMPSSVNADTDDKSTLDDASNSNDSFLATKKLRDQNTQNASSISLLNIVSTKNNLDLKAGDCEPNSGWMWTNGPTQPDTAIEVQQELSQMGIDAAVEARSYGETDSCGAYSHHGVDFTVTLKDTASKKQPFQQDLAGAVLPVLMEFGKPNLGNVNIISAQGEVIPTDIYNELSTAQELDADPLPADAITKQVYVIVYDPLLGNGQTLSQYMHWNDHAIITQQTIDFFKQYSNNKVNYTVVDTTVVTSGWPELIDGFSYTEQEYMAVWANPSSHHTPTEVNYNKIINTPAFDICGKLNRGEIDEVWMYGGPWFGYYESTLVGPGAYPFNSLPVSGLHNCNKILPIMGPSVERTVQEAVHNFTHRTEDTMKKVYGSWSQNNTSHSWNKFALVKAQSPNYSYGGCGSSHYPHNGASGYNYNNLSSVLSNCADFANYPNLGDPLLVAQPVNCSAWGCMELDYFRYWFGHMPSNPGCGPDNVANDWWNYIADPKVALLPSNACQTDMHLISGTTGVGGMTLSYTDGTPKNAVSDSYGNYFLMVSNHWSGTVTPSKAGYAFTPVSMDYVDIQVDQHSQNYVGTVFTYTISGNAGIGGVTLSYTEGAPRTAVADSNGNYSFVVPYNWSGTVTPAKAGYLFTPTSKSYSLVRADQASQNYVALVTISGNAGVGAATLSYTDGTLKTATADSGGNYSLNVSYNWSGAISPSRTGYTFTPVSKSYPNVGANQTGQDYTATAITFTISGNTGVGGATLNYTDGTAKTVLADGNGDYSFTVSYNWSGTARPVKPGYLFTPVSRSYSYTLANQTAQNYTTASGRIISGNAGVAGATLSYNNGGTKSAIADGNGDYIFTVSNNWSGTVTPSKTSYIFTPANRSYTSLQSDQVAQNYSVTPLYTVSGNTGIGGVTLNYMEDGTPKSVTSNSSGIYSFTIKAGWSGTVTPSKAGIIFEPASRVYTDTQANQPLQDFKAVVMVTNNADSGTGSLRQVLTDALAGATVRFDPSLAGQTITLASTLSVTKNMTIDGSDLFAPVEISGNNAVRIFSLGSSGGSVTLQSLVLKNGYVSGTNNGGAITVNGGSVTINGVTFIDNNAYNGGAIYSYFANVNLVVDQSEFISNDARNSGGAIYMQRSILTLRDSDLVGNTAVTGGAVHLYQGSPTVETSTFTTNTATNGGAIYYQFVDGPAILRGNLFSGNSASSNGGAVRVALTYSTYSVAIENNTFDSNQSDNGGALSVTNTVLIKNNTISQNNSTNPSGTGGASILFSTPITATLNNNILANKTGGVECSLSGTGTTSISGRNNLVEDGSGPCSNLPLTIVADPLLGTLADNGGSTLTLNLLPGSPAIDSGDDLNCVTTDQRSLTRPQGSHCDIGAYEFNNTVLSAPSGPLTSWNNTFNWTGFTGATWYLVEVQAADDTVILQKWYTADAAGCSGDLSCTVSPEETLNLPNGNYKWHILDYGDYGYGSWTTYTNFNLSAACYTLAMNVLPVGSGAINVASQNCSGGYLSGTVLQLTAIPNAGYAFTNWSGDVPGISNPVSITMNGNKNITANQATLGAVLNAPAGEQTSWNNTFSWTGVNGATWYLVQAQTNDDTVILEKWYTADAAGCSGDLSCTVSPGETLTLANGDYQWRILDYGDYGYGSWTPYMNFNLNAACYTLTTNVLPAGSGTFHATAQNCSGGYIAGTVVQLMAIPNSGYVFVNWSGDATGTVNPVSLVMDANKNVTANLTALGATLISPVGSLTSWDNTFSWTGLAGASWYLVQVQAADDTVILQKWYTSDAAGCSGDLSCAVSPEETLTLVNGNYKWRILDYGDYGYGSWSIYKDFSLNTTCYSLTTDVLPAGSGTVTASTQNCSGGYIAGTVVQVSVVPNSGYAFASWSGDADGTANPVSITMDGNKSVTANLTALGATLIAPVGALTSWDNTFSWTGINGGTWYLVQVQAVDDTVILQKWYTTDAAGCAGTTACFIIPPETASLLNGEYKWRILDYGDYGYGSWAPYMNFTLSP